MTVSAILIHFDSIFTPSVRSSEYLNLNLFFVQKSGTGEWWFIGVSFQGWDQICCSWLCCFSQHQEQTDPPIGGEILTPLQGEEIHLEGFLPSKLLLNNQMDSSCCLKMSEKPSNQKSRKHNFHALLRQLRCFFATFHSLTNIFKVISIQNNSTIKSHPDPVLQSS